MLRDVCIRMKIAISVLFLLTLNTALILLIGFRQETRLLGRNYSFSQPLPYNSFMKTIMLPDDEGFVFTQGLPLIGNEIGDEKDETVFENSQSLRIQILVVFGLSSFLGIVISLLTARSISRPILQLADASKRIANGSMSESLTQTRCHELRLLSDSFKKMQEGLKEREEEKSRLESVELTKNLAAGIAHEIKNPINTVGLIVDHLQTNLSPDDPEKRYEFYKLSENMKNEFKRINRIVEGFLRLTEPDVFNFKKEDVNLIIQETVSILEPEMIKQGVRFRLDLDPDLSLIKADRDKLRQVFSNLIINAVEAMPRGGDITLSTRSKDERRVEIQIRDNGIGIPQEDIRKIFSPYYTTKKQGFGLGLSLIHNIIHKHMERSQ